MRSVPPLLVLVLATISASPAFTGEPLAGVYALPDGTAKVGAILTVQPDHGLRRVLDVAMTPVGGTAPLARYETELSKELHVIAVSADLRDFVHEHGDKLGSDGHFRVPMTLPHAGPWHVYADGVPQGLGQQVMRFDLVVGASLPNRRSRTLRPPGWRRRTGATPHASIAST